MGVLFMHRAQSIHFCALLSSNVHTFHNSAGENCSQTLFLRLRLNSNNNDSSLPMGQYFSLFSISLPLTRSRSFATQNTSGKVLKKSSEQCTDRRNLSSATNGSDTTPNIPNTPAAQYAMEEVMK